MSCGREFIRAATFMDIAKWMDERLEKFSNGFETSCQPTWLLTWELASRCLPKSRENIIRGSRHQRTEFLLPAGGSIPVSQKAAVKDSLPPEPEAEPSRKRNYSPIRAPASTSKPTFSVNKGRKPRRVWPPSKLFVPHHNEVFRHRITHVLALREGRYVLTDGHRTYVRRDNKRWSQMFERDLMHMKLYILEHFCVDSTSSRLLRREKA
ncbi:hypothetical protein AVEN_116751-1 [Araneus ventricosus]|uniref:Uncharacterized protein n=1 Tax=Araneus ventricosus TaxID=182803 RepID=A0A4Y2QAV5_ARAVE|nr:hypothetical protein AVEN_116751-1 [Araneus ventricosus]